MPYTSLGQVIWGNGPTITATIYYDKQRAGADMQYRVKVVFDPLTSHYFSYPIYVSIFLDGVKRVDGVTVKQSSPSSWTSSLSYESSFITVSDKTAGTTALAVNIFSGSGSSRNATYTFSLPVDAAASTISTADGTLGSSQTITITKNSSDFLSTIVATSGDVSQTIATKTEASSISWTPSINFAAKNPNGTTVPVTIECITYAGTSGPIVGSTTITRTMTIAGLNPSVGSVTISDPVYSEHGVYVQGLSQITIETANPTGAYGSTIQWVEVEIQHNSEVFATLIGQRVQTPVLDDPGTYSIFVTVRDSRNAYDVYQQDITVSAYSAPEITDIAVERCDQDGTANPAGGYAKVTFSAVITEVTPTGGNSETYYLATREQGVSYWTETEITALADNPSPTDAEIIFEADVDTAYEAQITAVDPFASKTSTVVNIGTSWVLIQATQDMSGLSIGRRATKNDTLQVGITAEFDNGFLGAHDGPVISDELAFALTCGDGSTLFRTSTSVGSVLKANGRIDVYLKDGDLWRINSYTTAWSGWHYTSGIVEEGTSSGSSWRLWADGTLEQWTRAQFYVDGWGSWGGLYRSSDYYQWTFPKAFNAEPVVQATLESGAASVLILASSDAVTSTASQKFYAMSVANPTLPNCYISIYAVGKAATI